ncbi:DDB1- and CUL4-associated factor 12 [Nowakowskiella sp. JEL0078]|nr:DDB1- and CUL4-associated factor 12 [Nowakowskiella sp. JEL0078]
MLELAEENSHTDSELESLTETNWKYPTSSQSQHKIKNPAKMFSYLRAREFFPDIMDIDELEDQRPDESTIEETNTEQVINPIRARIKTLTDAPTDIPLQLSRALPRIRMEHEFQMKSYDKIFASAWLTSTQVVVGTKCNRLLIIDTQTGKTREIPPVPINLSSAHTTHNGDVRSAHAYQVTSNCCGIHSIAINPSRTLIAVGAGKPTEFIQVYRLPSFEPCAILSDHSDMVFTVAWLNDHTLVSGSRDTSVKVWDLKSVVETDEGRLFAAPYPPTLSHCINRKEHRGKVRDLRYNTKTRQFMTLSTDGYTKLWDASRADVDVISEVRLQHTNETVCLGLDMVHNLFSVGSQAHVSLVDPRSASIVHVLDSLDDGWGVRSLAFHHEILTVGGGLGRISFYDLRAQQYISWEESLSSPIMSTQPSPVRRYRDRLNRENSRSMNLDEKQRLFQQTSGGWLKQDDVYISHFQGIDVRNAVYTLSYEEELGFGCQLSDSSWKRSIGGRLFAAGGPLQLNLTGSYAALWA